MKQRKRAWNERLMKYLVKMDKLSEMNIIE